MMARLLLVALAVLSVIAFTDAQLRPMSLSQLVRGASPMQKRPGMQRQQSGLTRQQPGMQQQRPGIQQQRPGMPQQRPGMQQQGMEMMPGRPGMEETGGPRMWEKKKDEEKERWMKDSKDSSEESSERETSERSGEGEDRNNGQNRPAIPEETVERLREFYELVSSGCKTQATGTWADVCSYLSDPAVAEVVEVIWNAVRDAGNDEGDSAGVSDESTADSESNESTEESESNESIADSESDESIADSESDESTADSESDEAAEDSGFDAAGVLNNARNALKQSFRLN